MKRWLSSTLPDREAVLQQRWIRPFAHRLSHPSLWHFNRWSVSRGLALGLLIAFLVPLGQTPAAALLALTARANVIVAAVATFVTNPFTFAAIYVGAYQLGQRLIATENWTLLNPEAAETAFLQGLAWMLSVSVPTALGLIVFAVVSAAAGYYAVQLAWRIWVARRWARRRAEA